MTRDIPVTLSGKNNAETKAFVDEFNKQLATLKSRRKGRWPELVDIAVKAVKADSKNYGVIVGLLDTLKGDDKDPILAGFAAMVFDAIQERLG